MDPRHDPFDGFPPDMREPEEYRDFAEPMPPTDRQALAWLIQRHCGGVLHLGAEEIAEINRMHCERERGDQEWVFRAVKIQGMGS
jgi:hypothetical protein